VGIREHIGSRFSLRALLSIPRSPALMDNFRVDGGEGSALRASSRFVKDVRQTQATLSTTGSTR